MATVEKIRRDIEKDQGERSLSSRSASRSLEAQLVEEENLEIVRMVKAVKMDNRELTAFPEGIRQRPHRPAGGHDGGGGVG